MLDIQQVQTYFRHTPIACSFSLACWFLKLIKL